MVSRAVSRQSGGMFAPHFWEVPALLPAPLLLPDLWVPGTLPQHQPRGKCMTRGTTTGWWWAARLTVTTTSTAAGLP